MFIKSAIKICQFEFRFLVPIHKGQKEVNGEGAKMDVSSKFVSFGVINDGF
jgi:hypothetical protein